MWASSKLAYLEILSFNQVSAMPTSFLRGFRVTYKPATQTKGKIEATIISAKIALPSSPENMS